MILNKCNKFLRNIKVRLFANDHLRLDKATFKIIITIEVSTSLTIVCTKFITTRAFRDFVLLNVGKE